MADQKLTALTEVTTLAGADLIYVVIDTGGTALSRGIQKTNLFAGGWTVYSAVTPTRASADDPTYVLTFAGVDITGLISVGMKLKWTQDSSVRYGIVTKISFSTNTTLTLYGGTDYDVMDTASYTITAFNYSTAKAPLDFPNARVKWDWVATDSTERTQSSPSEHTWYNLGSFSLDVPIGAWEISYSVSAQGDYTGGNDFVLVYTTLSTGASTESEPELTRKPLLRATSGILLRIQMSAQASKPVDYSSKTTLYLNTKRDTVAMTGIINHNGQQTAEIKAKFDYL